jgi:rRNA processing protein Krr1/Pno1
MGVPGMMMSYHQQTAGGPGGAASSVVEAVPCRGREGAIIGKGGDMIKFIQTSTGCKLDMKRDVGTVQITGPPEGVAKARAFVEDVIEKGDTRGQGGLLDGVGGAAAPGYAAAAPGYAAAAPGYAAVPGAQQQPMGAAVAMGAMGMGGQQHAQPVAMMAVPVGAAAGGYYGVPQAYAPQAGAYAQPQAYVAAYQPQQQPAPGQPHAYAAYAQQPQQSAEQQQQGQQHQHARQQYGQDVAAAGAQQAEAGQQHGEWQTHYSEGRAYYYNTVTGETRWA